MQILKIGKVTLTDQDAKAARDSYPIATRSAIIPLRQGGFDQDGDTVVFQPTSMSRNMLIAGENKEEQVDSLKALLHKRTVLVAELRDGRQRATYVKLDSATFSESAINYDMQIPVNLSWTRVYPFWFDVDQIDFLDTGLTLDSGETCDKNYQQIVLTASPTTFSLSPAYNGSSPGRYVTFIFVPRAASSIEFIVVENLINGYIFRYNGEVAAEKQLYVDNMTKIVMNDSTDDWENFNIPDTKQTEIMRLEPSPGNDFRVTASITGTVDLYVRWVGEFI